MPPITVEFVVGSPLAPRGFSTDTPVFPSPQKPTFLNANLIWNPKATGLSVTRLLSSTLVNKLIIFKVNLFIHSQSSLIQTPK